MGFKIAKNLKRILWIPLLTGIGIAAFAEEKDVIATVGVRDTRYVYASYYPVRNVGLRLEQSLYSVAIGYQRTGIGLSYSHDFPFGLGLKGSIEGASTWKGSYQVYSAEIDASYRYKILQVTAAIHPAYDTGLHYYTAWAAGAEVLMTKNISFQVGYSTIPEYRMSEKRLRTGFGFNVNRLQVYPGLSFSMGDSRYFHDLRVLISMEYKFMR